MVNGFLRVLFLLLRAQESKSRRHGKNGRSFERPLLQSFSPSEEEERERRPIVMVTVVAVAMMPMMTPAVAAPRRAVAAMPAARVNRIRFDCGRSEAGKGSRICRAVGGCREAQAADDS